jgi:UDP-N-acetylmuramate dehydrogenase
MAQGTLQPHLADFADFVKPNEPLAPYTHLRLGGPADAVATPRSRDELCAFVRRCGERRLPLRVLGAGCGVVVPDEGVRAAVLRLAAAAFTRVSVEGRCARAGCGAPLADLIAAAVRHSLAGLEKLVGVPGTVGGALRQHGGEHAADLGQLVRAVEVVDASGAARARDPDELRLGFAATRLDDPVVLGAEFELEPDDPAAIIRRMRKAWIQRKAAQPFSFQTALRPFRSPRGVSADDLIEQAGLAGTRVGGAEVSERHAGYLVVNHGAGAPPSARDVLRLIDLVRSRVQERFGVELELAVSVW